MDSKKRFLVNISFYLAVAGIIYVIYNFLFKSLLPVIISLIIAVVVQKPSQYLSQKIKIKKQCLASVLGALVYILTAVIIGLGFYYVLNIGKDFMGEMSGISDDIGKLLSNLKNGISNLFSKNFPEFAKQAEKFISTTAESFITRAGDYLTKLIGGMATNTPAILFNTAISLVACCYIAKDYDKLIKFFKNLFGNKVYENTVRIKSILVDSVFKIFKGYVKLSSITFSVLLVAFWLLDINFFVLVALIVALVDLLPVLGTGTVLVPWGIIDIIAGNLKRGIIIIAVFVGITLIRNFLEPKIIARQVGINPLFMLLSIFLGLKLFGFIGVLLVPITMIALYEFYSVETDQTDQ